MVKRIFYTPMISFVPTDFLRRKLHIGKHSYDLVISGFRITRFRFGLAASTRSHKFHLVRRNINSVVIGDTQYPKLFAQADRFNEWPFLMRFCDIRRFGTGFIKACFISVTVLFKALVEVVFVL